MAQQGVVLGGRERETRKGAIDSVRKDFFSLLGDQDGKLGFLLQEVLYVMVSRFQVDFQGRRMRVWAGSTWKGSLTYVMA